MLDKKEIQASLNKFASDAIAIAKRNLKVKGTTNFRGERWRSTKKPRAIEASGRTGKSLKSNVKVMRNSFAVQFEGGDWVEFVENGRRKGKRPPTKPIIEWIKQKNVKTFKKTKSGGRVFVKRTPARIKSMAYAIAKRIGEEGTQATYFYSAAIEEALIKNENLVEDGLVASIDEYVEVLQKQLNNGFS